MRGYSKPALWAALATLAGLAGGCDDTASPDPGLNSLMRLSGTGVQFVVLPNVLNAPVNLTEKDQPAAEAIHALVQQLDKAYDGKAAAYCEPEGEVYVIGLRRARR